MRRNTKTALSVNCKWAQNLLKETSKPRSPASEEKSLLIKGDRLSKRKPAGPTFSGQNSIRNSSFHNRLSNNIRLWLIRQNEIFQESISLWKFRVKSQSWSHETHGLLRTTFVSFAIYKETVFLRTIRGLTTMNFFSEKSNGRSWPFVKHVLNVFMTFIISLVVLIWPFG